MATEANDTVTQPLPTPGAGPQMRMVEVALIEESLSNPRKHFDPAKLAELAESIKASGVHQPILLRPLPGTRLAETFGHRRQGAPLPAYELVAGARRLRACKLAKVAEVPAMIRELTDTEALEIQVVENLQREDVTELEEAEGYEVLMRTGNLNADQVGAKIGKSRSYVYARLKVLDLCHQAREALREGKIDFSRGLLIARIPDEALQIKALAFCTDADWEGDLPGYRECARYVQDEFMLRLDKARFNIADGTLVPSAGSCKDCSKRTGANPDLFADVKSADVCTDPKCYHGKEAAHSELVVAQAQAKGITVIAGKEAQELMIGGSQPRLKGYKRLDTAEDSPTDQPLRKIIGAQMEAEGIKPVQIAHPRKPGEMIDALPNEVVLRLLKAVEGQAQATKEVAAEVKEFADNKKAKALEKAKAQYEQAWRDGLLDRTWSLMGTESIVTLFSLDVHRYLVVREVGSLSTDDATAIADVLGLGRVGAHSALVDFAKTTPRPDMLQLLVIMQRDASAKHYAHNRPKNEGLMLVSGIVFKDDLDGVIDELQAQAREQYLPKPVKAAALKSASTPTPAAQALTTREEGKAKGGKGKAAPAAHARATAPKTSKAEASAQIAAQLAALEEQDQAPAAQGNEGAPAPAGGDAGDAAPSNAAGAVDPSIAWPKLKTARTSTATDCAAATHGEGGADVETGATVSAGTLAIGVRVKINATARGTKQALHVGKEGTIERKVDPEAWDVAIPREKRGVPLFVAFHASELEVVE